MYYTYDGAGRTASVSGDLVTRGVMQSYATNIQYSAFGGVAQEQFGTDTALYHRRHYNVRGQLYRVELGTGATEGAAWNRGRLLNHYGAGDYANWGSSGADNNGNVLRSHHYAPTDEAASGYRLTYQDYEYDALNRLKQVTEQNNVGAPLVTQSYGYDRFGNRTIIAAGGGAGNTQFTVETATNRLGVPAGQAGVMSYDAAGNLATDTYTGAGTRKYDAEGRMIEAADNSGGVVRYIYDGDGRRARRFIGGVEWRQIHSVDGLLLRDYVGGGVEVNGYVYRGGEMIAQADYEVATNTKKMLWMVSDHLGTPRIIVDETGGLSTTRRHDYLPFGEEVGAGVGGRTTGQGYSGNDGVRQKFTGYERDGETGLDFAQSRYYSSVQGRFTSPDQPFADQEEAFPQSWNLYSYVRNNPLRFTDPTGLGHYDENGNYVGDEEDEYDPELKASWVVDKDNPVGGYWDFGGDQSHIETVGNECCYVTFPNGVVHEFPGMEPSAGGGLRYVTRRAAPSVVRGLRGLAGRALNGVKGLFGKGAPSTLDDLFKSGRTPKASEIVEWAKSQGWTTRQNPNGPLKFIDENGVVRATIKSGSSRAPGSNSPHVELRDASGVRITSSGNPVTSRKSPDNHTPIDYDL